ncbi:hypothetical protein ACJVC5_04365 [Peredibacter sp. HCB2-198]|uniref:hypothetical protein n=1 Tax=Peredibacter sp. HCB2-198 TaxID=3383025 RepID=UPI0038B694FE
MSQTFFSKQDPTEKLSRLSLLGSSRGTVIVWLKGKKEKHTYQVLKFDKDREEIVLDSKDTIFTAGETVLCSFELRGMNFFSETIFQVSISGYNVLQVKNTLYKSERRSSYRLLTYPLYDVNVEFNLGEAYVGGKVVDMKSRSSQTGLFKNFLTIVGDEKEATTAGEKLKIRVQDLSTTGMAIHVGELESKHFQKDLVFQNVDIRFTDEVIQVPEVKVVYVVDYISNDKNIKKYKVGLHFQDLPTLIDDQIGKKINRLLRENDFNKDFENFIK